jgi:hypothetical protein
MLAVMRPALTILALLLGAAASAHAESAEASPAEVALARELFADATLLEARADWLAATAKLKRAILLKETPGLYYHLAHCEEQLGALVAASQDYGRASELIRSGAVAPDVEPLLPLAERRIASRVAKLELVVPAGLVAVAELDGRELPPSALGASIPVDPGAHHVVLRAQGRPDFQADLALSSGEHRTLKVFFGADRQPVPPSGGPPSPQPVMKRIEPAPDARRDERSWFGAREGVMMGEAALALAGVGVGVGYAVARRGATEDVRRAQHQVDVSAPGDLGACSTSAPVPACAALARAIDDHQRAVILETAGFLAAGVAGAAFALTWTLWPSAPSTVAVQVGPHEGAMLLHVSGAL